MHKHGHRKEGLGIISISNVLRSDEFVEKLSGSDDSWLSDTGGSSSPDLGVWEG
jgi:hypothetical protein